MSRVILQPAGNRGARKHYANTIQTHVSMDRIRPHVDTNVWESLAEIFPSHLIPTWGVTPGKDGVNYRKWLRIQPGDVTLFAKEGAVFALGTVVLKTHSDSLALELWDRQEDGQTWEYMYFLIDMRKVHIPYDALNRAAGYQPNNVVQGFNVLNEKKSLALMERFDLHSLDHGPEVTEDEYNQVVEELDLSGALDAVGTTNVRKEQKFLRRKLFGRNQVGKCGICGQRLPVGLLVAAHIKKRAECTVEEKRDYSNVVMSMCAFGCDQLYERGYIGVREGIVTRIPRIPRRVDTADLAERLDELEGHHCGGWSEARARYFRWHWETHII